VSAHAVAVPHPTPRGEDAIPEPIGLIGVGLVGTALAERLRKAGFEVIGYDIVPEKRRHLESLGGQAVGGPAEVASRASRVILSLPTSHTVREVIEGPGGVLEAEPLPRTIIDTTTGDPEATEAMAAKLAERGIAYLDATIVGSSAQIREGAGVFLVGGEAEPFEECVDILEALGEGAFHVGRSGAGARAKLVVNLVLGLNRAALAEGLAFAEAIGLEPAQVLPLLMCTAAYSRIMDTKGRKMVESDFTPEARLSQHRKDVALILDAAQKAGQSLPLSEEHLRLLDAAIGAGHGDLDNSAVIRELRRRQSRR
jgi:3-hydroxyisobutyrate dehydrogenase-like beta-hydroxyacid dehydrogenase